MQNKEENIKAKILNSEKNSKVISIIADRGNGKTTTINKVKKNLEKNEEIYVHKEIINLSNMRRFTSIFETILSNNIDMIAEKEEASFQKKYKEIINTLSYKYENSEEYYDNLPFNTGIENLEEEMDYIEKFTTFLFDLIEEKYSKYVIFLDDFDMSTQEYVNKQLAELSLFMQNKNCEKELVVIVSYNEEQFLDCIEYKIEDEKLIKSKNNIRNLANKIYEKIIPIENRYYLIEEEVRNSNVEIFLLNAPKNIKSILKEKSSENINEYIIKGIFNKMNMDIRYMDEVSIKEITKVLPNNYRGLNQLILYLNSSEEINRLTFEILLLNNTFSDEKTNNIYNILETDIENINFSMIKYIDGKDGEYFRYLNDNYMTSTEYSYADIVNCIQYKEVITGMDQSNKKYITMLKLVYIYRVFKMKEEERNIVIGIGQISKKYTSRKYNQRNEIGIYKYPKRKIKNLISKFKLEEFDFLIDKKIMYKNYNYEFSEEFLNIIEPFQKNKDKKEKEEPSDTKKIKLIALDYLIGEAFYEYLPFIFTGDSARGKKDKNSTISIEGFLENNNFISKLDYQKYNVDVRKENNRYITYINDEPYDYKRRSNNKSIVEYSSNFNSNVFSIFNKSAFKGLLKGSKEDFINLFLYEKFNRNFVMRQSQTAELYYCINRFLKIVFEEKNWAEIFLDIQELNIFLDNLKRELIIFEESRRIIYNESSIDIYYDLINE